MTSDSGPPGRSKALFAMGLASAMIISGTMSTVLAKIQFETMSVGTEVCTEFAPTPAPSVFTDDTAAAGGTGNPESCRFDKPWFSVVLMKLGMALCILFTLNDKSNGAAKVDAPSGEPLLDGGEGGEVSFVRPSSRPGPSFTLPRSPPPLPRPPSRAGSRGTPSPGLPCPRSQTFCRPCS